MKYILKGTVAGSSTPVYFTGRAGAGWISENIADAFAGWGDLRSGAVRAAEARNRTAGVTGVMFKPVSI